MGAVLWPRALTAGQAVTLLVGVTVEVLEAHRDGTVVGPLHPRRLEVDATGRPVLAPAPPPPGWTTADDLVAVTRLARALGLRPMVADDLREGLRRLLVSATPEPLPDLTLQGQHAARPPRSGR
jgi:hypothetical protein